MVDSADPMTLTAYVLGQADKSDITDLKIYEIRKLVCQRESKNENVRQIE